MKLIAGAGILVAIIVRFVDLGNLPGEWFGDISNVHEYVMQVLQGKWPWYFFQSAGPLYHYFIAPVVMLLPLHGYDLYKVTSVLVSLLGIYVTYEFFRTSLPSKSIAALTIFVMGTGYWYLIWSRLGNSQIIIPLLVSFVSLLTAKFIMVRRPMYAYGAVAAAGLGWFVYPHTYILPIATYLSFLCFFLFNKKFKIHAGMLLRLAGITAIGITFFLHLVIGDASDNFGSSGYVGKKVLPIFSMPLATSVGRTVSNFLKTMGMFHFKGDMVFRINVSGHPHIDLVSGILMLLGIWYFIKQRWYWQLGYMLFMSVMLILPSISPAIAEGEIPNSGRTIALAPFVYGFIATGYIYFYQALEHRLRRAALVVLIIGIFVISFIINMRLYFSDYRLGLPEYNLAPGKHIAAYIDYNYPQNVAIYFSDCCWGEYGEPEPKGIAYVLSKNQTYPLLDRFVASCRDVERRPAIIFGNVGDVSGTSALALCSPHASVKQVIYKGETLGSIIFLPD